MLLQSHKIEKELNLAKLKLLCKDKFLVFLRTDFNTKIINKKKLTLFNKYTFFKYFKSTTFDKKKVVFPIKFFECNNTKEVGILSENYVFVLYKYGIYQNLKSFLSLLLDAKITFFVFFFMLSFFEKFLFLKPKFLKFNSSFLLYK